MLAASGIQVPRSRGLNVMKDTNGVDRPVNTNERSHERSKVCFLNVAPQEVAEAPRSRVVIVRGGRTVRERPTYTLAPRDQRRARVVWVFGEVVNKGIRYQRRDNVRPSP